MNTTTQWYLGMRGEKTALRISPRPPGPWTPPVPVESPDTQTDDKPKTKMQKAVAVAKKLDPAVSLAAAAYGGYDLLSGLLGAP